jgi:hypothetical protein
MISKNMAKSNKSSLKFGSDKQKVRSQANTPKGLPTEGREFSTLGKPDNFSQKSGNDSGFPRQDRGFSTLGKLNKQGTYTNAKFNQALAGNAEDISSKFLGTQQLNIGGGFGKQPDDPKVPYVETFYILAEDGDILNSGPCGMESDPLLWLV